MLDLAATRTRASRGGGVGVVPDAPGAHEYGGRAELAAATARRAAGGARVQWRRPPYLVSLHPEGRGAEETSGHAAGA